MPSTKKMFGVSAEEREQVVRVLAEAGQEGIGSMGDDTPLPVLSRQPRSIFDNFRQLFAQVTNPPIDSLREQTVMSLETVLGPELNPFAQMRGCRRIAIDSPVLSEQKFLALTDVAKSGFRSCVLDLNVPAETKIDSGIRALCDTAVASVRDAATTFIVLSDENIVRGRIPIPALLVCGALHQRLVREELRCRVNIIVASASVRDPHHFATLIGYGATAIFPYLAYHLLIHMWRTQNTEDNRDLDAWCGSYRKSINKGLYKIISKMGISTIASYRGSALFEIVGLHDEVTELCFPGTVSRIQGARFEDLHADQARLGLAGVEQESADASGRASEVHA